MAEAMAQDPTVYEYDEVYDSIEDDRKKAVAAKLGMGKNKPKYISSLKEAAEQRQREYERVIERKVSMYIFCRHTHLVVININEFILNRAHH